MVIRQRVAWPFFKSRTSGKNLKSPARGLGGCDIVTQLGISFGLIEKRHRLIGGQSARFLPKLDGLVQSPRSTVPAGMHEPDGMPRPWIIRHLGTGDEVIPKLLIRRMHGICGLREA